MSSPDLMNWLQNLNALIGGFFLLTLYGILAMRQVQGCLRLFIVQSLCLSLSSFLLSMLFHSWEVFAVGVIDLMAKPFLIPWLLRRNVPRQIYSKREITQVFGIPTSLLIALALTILGYLVSSPLLHEGNYAAIGMNLPIGFAGLFLGAFTAAARREAVPVLLGLISMENAAFFAGIAIAPTLPLIAYISIAFDVLVLTFIIAVLTRAVHEHIGTTEVGALTTLRERK